MKKVCLLFLVVILVGPAIAEVASAAELVGYWNFEESGGITVNDQSGYGNHGQISDSIAVQRSQGRFGKGLNFIGRGGAWVKVPSSSSLDTLPEGFSICVWIKPSHYHSTLGTLIFSKGGVSEDPSHIALEVSAGALSAVMNNSLPPYPPLPGAFRGASSNVINLNEWHFVVWTYDNADQRLYNNGSEVFTASFSTPWIGNADDLDIGHKDSLAGNFMGVIDEARIYRGALTRQEILDLMNTSPISDPPIADASTDLIADANEEVILDGTASHAIVGNLVTDLSRINGY